MPAEPKNCDAIAWWRICRHRTPRLAKMAQQFLATPATSAGVERLFSAVGLHYSDLASSMHEDSLAHRLLAAWNYTHALNEVEA